MAPADDFSFVAEGGGRRFTMGETALLDTDLVLKAGGRVPAGAQLTLKRDGRVVTEARERFEVPVPGAGVYRVEVRLPGESVPWILTNPIYVFDYAMHVEREQRAEWPSDPPAPPAALVIDNFEGKTAFVPGADTMSEVKPEILDAQAGIGGGAAARLQFRLGVPTADHPHVFAALVDWTKRDLAGRTGLVFSIRADGEYRIWVQVRDENPASRDEGTEWWFASVKTMRDWQRIALPFAGLRSINPNTDGRLDLDKVRALVFVLDRGALKPGTTGTIWVDDVGVY
jgi:hypothetical protein